MRAIFWRIKNILLGVMVVLVISLAGINWYNHKTLQNTRETVVQLESKTKSLERDYKRLEADFNQTMTLIRNIREAQKKLSIKHQQLSGKLKDVSQESKEYLNTPIPSDITRVLDQLLPDEGNHSP